MLWQYFINNNKKIIHKSLHYFPIYERHFARYINQPLIFWEIGVQKGGSLQMWKQYFGPHAIIVGIDIDDDCKQHEEHNINICIGDQSDHAFLEGVIKKFGVPDIVLDDGSHKMSDITSTFSFMYDKLPKNGIYAVEDLHTAYWEEYEGGLRRKGTFIEYCKDLIDELNAFGTKGQLKPTKFTQETSSIHFYDSVIVFERSPHTRRTALATGAPHGDNAVERKIEELQGQVNALANMLMRVIENTLKNNAGDRS
jgi:hypothetical protein